MLLPGPSSLSENPLPTVSTSSQPELEGSAGMGWDRVPSGTSPVPKSTDTTAQRRSHADSSSLFFPEGQHARTEATWMNPAEGISQVAGFIGVLWSENVKPDSPALKPEPLSADQIVILEVGGEKRGVSKSHSHAAVKARAPSLGASPMVATGVSRYDDLSSASTNARNGSDGSIASPGRLAQPSKAIGDLGAYLAFTEARRLPSMCRPEKLSSGRGQFSLGSPHAQLAASPLKSEASEVDDALSSIGSNLDNEFVTKLLGDPSTTPILKSLLEFPSLRPNAGGRRRSLLLAGDTSKTMPDLRGGPAERPEAGEGSPIIESHTQRCRYHSPFHALSPTQCALLTEHLRHQADFNPPAGGIIRRGPRVLLSLACCALLGADMALLP